MRIFALSKEIRSGKLPTGRGENHLGEGVSFGQWASLAGRSLVAEGDTAQEKVAISGTSLIEIAESP